ncbi:MAG: peptidoglycan DD-metalloendopeptidase family protein [Azoarcus sp.]|nr:peptidoglycan DD-metalloendopeptidase family protein [Azoarcus sp.]
MSAASSFCRRVAVAVLVLCAGLALCGAAQAAPSGRGKAKAAKTVRGKAAQTAEKPAPPARKASRSSTAAKPARSTKSTRPGRDGRILQETKAEISAKRSDLQDIKRRIDEARRDVEKSEAAYVEATASVSEAERDVSKAARALRRVTGERTEAERQLATLETEQGELDVRIASRQEELAGWLRRNYLDGTGNSVASLIAAGDPNQIVREAYYLELLGKARMQKIESLRADVRLKAELAKQVDHRRETLTYLEKERIQRQEDLARTHADRRAAQEKIAANLKVRRESVGTLKADEKRLSNVLETLARRAAEAEARAAAAAAAKREQEKRRAQSRRDPVADRVPRHVDEKPATEPVRGKVREVAGPGSDGGRFAQQRGRLRFPVTGDLVGRFGAPRAGQATTWRGVFIRAASGTEVRAVSAGDVVYSNWLRGYGNLLIVDHGDGYLSIYGNNDALYKEVGQSVRGGEAIASVGSSGVEADSGLYFEIRHRGQAVDPMQWVRLK